MNVLPTFAFPDDPALSGAIEQAMARVVAGHQYVLGPEVEAFEREFGAYCGAAHAIGVANGSDAIELSLRAAGVAAGDRVASVANAGGYASAAIRALGATPVWVDVDEDLAMSAADLARAIAGTRAVVVTHLYGRAAAIVEIAALAAAAGAVVIEDCAQAHGARVAGRHVGTFGAAGCFSFYPTKNLGALGDGGAIVTDDAVLAAKLRSLRQHGWGDKYRVERAGGRNSRLDALQAAFLRAKLPYLDRWNARRVEIASRYRDGLRDLPLRIAQWRDGEYVAHLFVIRSHQRERLRTFLADAGIATAIHFPCPDHRQPAYASEDHRALPVTEAACGEILSLPCFPGMTDPDVERVIAAIHAFHERHVHG